MECLEDFAQELGPLAPGYDSPFSLGEEPGWGQEEREKGGRGLSSRKEVLLLLLQGKPSFSSWLKELG